MTKMKRKSGGTGVCGWVANRMEGGCAQEAELQFPFPGCGDDGMGWSGMGWLQFIWHSAPQGLLCKQ